MLKRKIPKVYHYDLWPGTADTTITFYRNGYGQIEQKVEKFEEYTESQNSDDEWSQSNDEFAAILEAQGENNKNDTL